MSMVLNKIFPCALVLCSIVSLLAATTSAQSLSDLPTQATNVTAATTSGVNRLENDPVVIISVAEETKLSSHVASPSAAVVPFSRLLDAAIDNRLGARYVYGAVGPSVFDCSGFVWSVFQSVGINFERGSARSIWSRFAPARTDERFKFGTLVFFSGLSHIGIVADEHGFYHASRSHGVAYAPFNKYWLSRIDGFRRVPLPVQQVAE